MRLRDKVAVITGAGAGIGRAAAVLFAKEGARVLCADLDSATGEETVAQVRTAGGEGVLRRCAWLCLALPHPLAVAVLSASHSLTRSG